MNTESNHRPFSLEIPLPYEQALIAANTLQLIRKHPPILPGPEAPQSYRFEQMFPHDPLSQCDEEVAQAVARLSEVLVPALRALPGSSNPQKRLAAFDTTVCTARRVGAQMTVRLSADNWTVCSDTAITVIQVCQKELGAPAVGFICHDQFFGDATGVAIAPGQTPVWFSAAPPPDPLLELGQKCHDEMKRLQKRHGFDLTDGDHRAELAEKSINEVMWATPLYEKLQATAKRWGKRPAAQPQPAPALGVEATP